MSEIVVTGVLIALVAASLRWLIPRFLRNSSRAAGAAERRTRDRIQDQREKRARNKAEKERGVRITKAVEQRRGPVPIKQHGSHPTVVTYSDGSERYYFGHDLAAYKRAMESGRYPINRTFHTNAPKVIE